MGLFTGFSIISGVEIIFFFCKSFYGHTCQIAIISYVADIFNDLFNLDMSKRLDPPTLPTCYQFFQYCHA